jgi:choline dehydrogenase-like flavoprotein
MQRLPHLSLFLSLHVDGLLPGDEGGTVSLRPDGRMRLDYPVGSAYPEAFRASAEAMARVHLAAGARKVYTAHSVPVELRSEADLPLLAQAKWGAFEHLLGTAHQMGGCPMGADPARSVVDLQLRHRQVHNLFVVDGSVLPTALGVNPSETIYGLAHWATDGVASAV